jgi:hypothetical protein
VNDLLGYNIPRAKLLEKAENNTYWQSCVKFVSELELKEEMREKITLTWKQENWLEKIEKDLAQN